MCSKTFDDSIFEDLFEAKYGLTRASIKKMNIKGVFQIWTHDGGYVEVPLKEAHAFTRDGCKQCPDFAAEHADVSAGGIGAFGDWTLVIARTDVGRDLIESMRTAGLIETRPGDDDPGAIALLQKLARVSRRRWPETADPAPRRLAVTSS
jgi:coenzyme F420 hydrogenase subunit beta